MGGFGSAQSMNTIMKNNRAQLGKRKSMFSSKKDYIGSSKESEQEEFIDHKAASPELLEEIRSKLLKERAKSFKVSLLFFLLISVFSIGVTFHYFTNVKKANENQKTAKVESFKISKKNKDFLLIIKDADEWMEIGKFENAIFQYTRASKLIPNQFDVEYRICLSYSYLCRYNQLECEKGKEILFETMEKFPNEEKLKELAIYF